MTEFSNYPAIKNWQSKVVNFSFNTWLPFKSPTFGKSKYTHIRYVFGMFPLIEYKLLIGSLRRLMSKYTSI